MSTKTQQDSQVVQRDEQALADLSAEERRLVEDFDKRAAKRRRLRQVLNYVPLILGY